MSNRLKYCVFKVFPHTHKEYNEGTGGVTLLFIFTAPNERESYNAYTRFLRQPRVLENNKQGIRYIKEEFNDLMAQADMINYKMEAINRRKDIQIDDHADFREIPDLISLTDDEMPNV